MARQRTEEAVDVPETQVMEVGGSGTATVSFKDAMEADVKLKTVTWTASGGLSITPDPEDPTTAKLFAATPGQAIVTATAEGESGGRGTVQIAVSIRPKGTPHVGEIALTVEPAPPPVEPVEPPVEPVR